MQEYGELALALVAEKNSNDEDQVFNQAPEFNAGSLFVEENEETLIWEKLIEGDKLALEELYNKYANTLFSYGMYHSKDRAYVLDCIHDLFVDLFKYRKNLSRTDNVKSYLFKSLKRKINKKYRTKNVSVSLDEFEFITDFNQKNHTNSCEKSIISQENTSEINKKLGRALETLTKKQRKILFLRFDQDRSFEEIAAIMEVSVQTARTSVYRAIKTLRKLKF